VDSEENPKYLAFLGLALIFKPEENQLKSTPSKKPQINNYQNFQRTFLYFNVTLMRFYIEVRILKKIFHSPPLPRSIQTGLYSILGELSEY